MIPQAITRAHHAAILRNNQQYVDWLAPLNASELAALLAKADYARQLADGEAMLIAYDGSGPYRHRRVDWLSVYLDRYVYIDRIIIGEAVQRQGLGRLLYDDVADYTRALGHSHLACEVNTVPDNPGSHAFHRSCGFIPIGEQTDPDGKAVRYYVRKL